MRTLALAITWLALCATPGLSFAQDVRAPAKERVSSSPSDEAMARVALSGFASVAERRLIAISRMLSVLGETAEVQSGDWEKMRHLVRAVGASGIPANATWFARPDGHYFTAERGELAESLADRPYFERLRAGQSVPAALVISRSTGKRSIVVAEPVKRNGAVIGALGVSMSMDALSRSIDEELGLGPEFVFYALDAEGRTALHRRPELMFELPSELGGPSLKAAVAEMLSRPEGVVRYEFRGTARTVVYRRSARLGWVFAVGPGRPSTP